MIGERDYMRNDGGGSRGNYPWSNWSAVKTLLIINIIVFFLCNLGETGKRLTILLSLNRFAFYDFKFWGPITYMFTHATFWHFFGNMWSLWLFGGLIENTLGKARTFQLYIFSGLIGAGLWMLANWTEPLAICIGASGSVFGFMVAAAMAFPNVKLQLIFPPVSMKMRTFAIFYCIYEIFAEMSINDNVAHLAHLGGALGAVIFMRALLKKSSKRNNSNLKWLKNIFHKKNSAPPSSGSSSGGLGELDSDEVDRVLDKLATTGRSSLTPEETALLEEASRRLRDR